MDEKKLNFIDSLNTRVTFKKNDSTQEIQGHIEINRNQLPRLTIEDLPLDKHWDNETINHITCNAGAQKYTLVSCDLRGPTIYPKFIVNGDYKDEIEAIEILLSGFSGWFDQFTCFDIHENQIKKEIPEEKINETITISGRIYKISSNYNVDIKHAKERDFTVSEYTTIKIESLSEKISIDHAEKLAHDIRKIFSLLTACPLSIQSTWIIEKNSKARKSFYFWYSAELDPPYETQRECLIHPRLIFDKNMWGTIFGNYYSESKSDLFKNIWSRLPSLYSYKGSWEYEFLGYVSILDAYCDQNSNKKGKKLKPSIYKKLKRELISHLETFQSNLAKEDKNDSVFESFKAGIDAISNTDMPTFKEKFEFLLSSLNDEIKNVIDFSATEFKLLKDIRDAAAHGQPVKLSDGRNLTNETKTKDKLLVFLTYLVYRDFGFTPVDFAKLLRGTSNKFVQNAEINILSRDRLSGDVPFYEIDLETYENINNRQHLFLGFEYVAEENLYRFHDSITKAIKQWYTGNSCKQFAEDHIRDTVPNLQDMDIRLENEAYFSYEGNTVHANCLCIISKNK